MDVNTTVFILPESVESVDSVNVNNWTSEIDAYRAYSATLRRAVHDACNAPLTSSFVAHIIKPISHADAVQDYTKLCGQYSSIESVSNRCRIGNNVVDRFTFKQRLQTRGKYNASFIDFLKQYETFETKPFIQNMIRYYSKTKDVNRRKRPLNVL